MRCRCHVRVLSGVAALFKDVRDNIDIIDVITIQQSRTLIIKNSFGNFFSPRSRCFFERHCLDEDSGIK